MGYFDKIAQGVEAKDLTGSQIETFLKGLVEPSDEGIDAEVLLDALKGVNMNITES